jgi:hypothetical protein
VEKKLRARRQQGRNARRAGEEAAAARGEEIWKKMSAADFSICVLAAVDRNAEKIPPGVFFYYKPHFKRLQHNNLFNLGFDIMVFCTVSYCYNRIISQLKSNYFSFIFSCHANRHFCPCSVFYESSSSIFFQIFQRIIKSYQNSLVYTSAQRSPLIYMLLIQVY